MFQNHLFAVIFCVCALLYSDVLRSQFTVLTGGLENSLVVSNTNVGNGGKSRIGIGTDTPEDDLHIIGGADAGILLEDVFNVPYKWKIEAHDLDFSIDDAVLNREPFVIESEAQNNSLVIDKMSDGAGAGSRIGLGTDSPETDLHIVGGSIATIRLEDSFDQLQKWDIQATNTSLRFNDVTNNFNSILTLRTNTGDIGIGETNPEADLDIKRGSNYSRVNAGEEMFTVNSSRIYKENISPIEISDILSKVSQVSVQNYDWRTEGFVGTEVERINRIGLIAEEFHTILERGSDKEISGKEVQMVLWMAVQELIEENKALRDRLDSMESRMKRAD